MRKANISYFLGGATIESLRSPGVYHLTWEGEIYGVKFTASTKEPISTTVVIFDTKTKWQWGIPTDIKAQIDIDARGTPVFSPPRIVCIQLILKWGNIDMNYWEIRWTQDGRSIFQMFNKLIGMYGFPKELQKKLENA